MKKLFVSMFALIMSVAAFAQLDTDQFALDVSKADAANTEQLKAFIWKRHATATVDGEVKATVVNEVSFDETGKIQVTNVDTQSNVKQKRGVRGKIQENAIEGNVDYVESALEMALAYTYMSKGQLLDFFGTATITDAGDKYQITGANVFVQGDSLTVVVEKATNLFLSKGFSSMLDEDPISGEIQYAKFSSGVSHGFTTVMNLPGKKAIINAKNQDYTARIQ